ncbi:hypothetical protein J2D73_10235 [Acetobacter sacchari]|uniref:Uncharacterized protein n=1 Tax=Acetobacter sacchari TaxID=2661687 RepID=A0ABS3LW80_9PROT|nr:hypothetical protein [Acetobacter sacchari]MBO1360176.1 hypothetical protein [Acetobacter sacchari]
MKTGSSPQAGQPRPRHGDVLIAIENLAQDITQHGRDYVLQRLSDPELRQFWASTLDAIPPEYWDDVRKALDELTGEHGSAAGLLPAESVFGRGVFGRGRVETISRLLAPERLQILANLLPARAPA